MCSGTDTHPKTKCSDPALDLAELIIRYSGTHIAPSSIRVLIKNRWDDIKRLAHAIRHEETSQIRHEARKIAAELDGYSRY